MKLITGDETGLLKLVDITKRNYLTYFPSIGKQSRSWSIKGMCWINPNESFAIVRANGLIEYFTYSQDELKCIDSFDSQLSNPVDILSLHDNNDILVCFDNLGQVKVINKSNYSKNEPVSLNSSFQVRGPIDAGATSLNTVAFGGQENDIKLWDLTTQTACWSAKNVPYDNLSLRVPIWITAICFLNDAYNNNSSISSNGIYMNTNQKSTNSNCNSNSVNKSNSVVGRVSTYDSKPGDTVNPSAASGGGGGGWGSIIVTGTAYKQVRLYDIRVNRQPEISFEIGEFRVSSILPGTLPNTLYVGDVSGGINLWDLRMQRRLATLRGGVGCVRDIQTNKKGNAIATVGLERFAKLYDNSTKLRSTSTSASQGHFLGSAYLKNRLNCCLLLDGVLPVVRRDLSGGEAGSDDKDEEDEDGDAEGEDLVRELLDSDQEEDPDDDDEDEDEDGDVEGMKYDGLVNGDDDEDDEDEDMENEDDDDDDEDDDEDGDTNTAPKVHHGTLLPPAPHTQNRGDKDEEGDEDDEDDDDEKEEEERVGRLSRLDKGRQGSSSRKRKQTGGGGSGGGGTRRNPHRKYQK